MAENYPGLVGQRQGNPIAQRFYLGNEGGGGNLNPLSGITSLRWFNQRPLRQDHIETNVVAFPLISGAPSNTPEPLPLAAAS